MNIAHVVGISQAFSQIKQTAQTIAQKRVQLRKDCIEKCKKHKLFHIALGIKVEDAKGKKKKKKKKDDSDLDSDGNEKLTIEKVLEKVGDDEIEKILSEPVKELYNEGDIKAAMKFVNEQLSEQRYEMIAAIEFEQQMIENKLDKPDYKSEGYAKRKKVYDEKKDDINKVREFLDSWFE